MPLNSLGPNRMTAWQPRGIPQHNAHLAKSKPTTGLGPQGMPGSADFDPNGNTQNAYTKMGLYWTGHGVSQGRPLDTITQNQQIAGNADQRADTALGLSGELGRAKVGQGQQGLDQRSEQFGQTLGLNAELGKGRLDNDASRVQIAANGQADANTRFDQSMGLNQTTQAANLAQSFTPESAGNFLNAGGKDPSSLVPRAPMKAPKEKMPDKSLSLKELGSMLKQAKGLWNTGLTDVGDFDGPDEEGRAKAFNFMAQKGLTPDDITDPEMRRVLGFDKGPATGAPAAPTALPDNAPQVTVQEAFPEYSEQDWKAIEQLRVKGWTDEQIRAKAKTQASA